MFTRIVAGKAVEARAVEWLRGISTMAGVKQSQRRGGLIRMMQVGGALCATYMDSEMIRTYFGRRRKVESAEMLERIAREGVLAEIYVGGNLESELEYRNHRNTVKYRGEVLKKLAMGMARGRTIWFLVTQALVIRGLRTSPVRVLEEKNKLWVTHDMAFDGWVTVREKR